MPCEALPPMYVLAAVALAIMAPKEWHDVFLDVIKQKWGVGPGMDDQGDE